MKLTDLSSRTTDWFKGGGPLSDIVISSRIRLARNLAGFNFITKCTDQQKQEILSRLKEIILGLETLGDLFFIDIGQGDQVERDFLIERHLISKNLASGIGARGVVIAKNELFGAMINEEDHLRMQVLGSGLDVKNCWQKINEIDNLISEKVKYAFSSKYGYLTACPTNVGTGIRVSVMLHLPGLKMTEHLKKMIEAVREMNLTVRGLFGEGTEAVGDFFQVSNQVTLGVSEEKIVNDFGNIIIPKIVEYEKQAREQLLSRNINLLDDKISRALALLKNAKLISSHEALFLLSNLRLGINMGRIKDISISTINDLFMLTQPAHLQMNSGHSLTAAQRDMLRAQTLKSRLN
ncbi:MAG: protein arginine kinase [Anaerohalosphaeraceae bacterium]|nr:protein arginine kinase [Anaerohalosphaeraceae bacterium]